MRYRSASVSLATNIKFKCVLAYVLEQLQATFYRLVKINNGYITVMRLAAETGLSAKTAQLFLDAQAKEFNASYEVNEKGDVVYRFPI